VIRAVGARAPASPSHRFRLWYRLDHRRTQRIWIPDQDVGIQPASLMLRHRLRPVAVVMLLGIPALATQQANHLVGAFSARSPDDTLDDWETLRFPSVDIPTSYRLVEHHGQTVLEANSHASASALFKRERVDLSRYPILTWRWKTAASCFVGDWHDPERDDYPLRLFVIFEPSGGVFSFWRRLRPGFAGDAVLYVNDPREGLTGNDPSSHVNDRIKVITLSHPPGDDDSWRQQRRDVRRDYQDLFGRAPRDVAGVAVMTDTDNSGTECVSYFGDISFGEKIE